MAAKPPDQPDLPPFPGKALPGDPATPDRAAGDYGGRSLFGGFRTGSRMLAFLLLGILGIAAFGLLLQTADGRLNPIVKAAAEARALAREARAAEVAAWSLRAIEQSYRKEPRADRAETHETLTTQLTTLVNGLYARTEGQATAENVSTASEALNQLTAAFRDYVTATRALGLNPEDGFLGLLVQSGARATNAVDATNRTELSATMNQIRKLEADFLAFNRLKDLSQINRVFEVFVAELEKARLGAARTREITQLMRTYDTNLKAIAKARVAQGQASDRLDDIFAYMVPSLEGLSAFAAQRLDQMSREEARIRTEVKVLLAGGAAVIIALLTLLGLLLLGSMTGPIKRLARAATSLANGAQSVVIPALGNADELGDIARALALTRTQMDEQARLAGELEQARLQLKMNRDAVSTLTADDSDDSDDEAGGAAPADVTRLQGELAAVKAQVLRGEAEVKRLKNALSEAEAQTAAQTQAAQTQAAQTQAAQTQAAASPQATEVYRQQVDRSQADLAASRAETQRLRQELADAQMEIEQAEKALLSLRQANLHQAQADQKARKAEAELRGGEGRSDGRGDERGPISSIGREVADASRSVSDAAEEAERTGLMIRGLVDADTLIGEVDALLKAIAEQTNFLVFRQGAPWIGDADGLGANESVGERFDAIRANSNQATRLLLQLNRTLGNVKAVALEIASDTSEQALAITSALLSQSESLRGMLDDLVGTMKPGEAEPPRRAIAVGDDD